LSTPWRPSQGIPHATSGTELEHSASIVAISESWVVALKGATSSIKGQCRRWRKSPPSAQPMDAFCCAQLGASFDLELAATAEANALFQELHEAAVRARLHNDALLQSQVSLAGGIQAARTARAER